MPPPPGGWWDPQSYVPDVDVRIEALGSLMPSSPERVIPVLKAIALDPSNTTEGRRAVLVLAQSDNPQAEMTVFELAQRAAEPVRLAAIREMGRLDSSSAHTALLKIARTEADPTIRDTAIVTLGRAGARQQLRTLYAQMDTLSARLAVLTALFNTRDEDELIRIAMSDKSAEVRAQARRQLALLGTPKAKAFLAKNKP
jgi:HEAT repeat protein